MPEERPGSSKRTYRTRHSYRRERSAEHDESIDKPRPSYTDSNSNARPTDSHGRPIDMPQANTFNASTVFTESNSLVSEPAAQTHPSIMYRTIMYRLPDELRKILTTIGIGTNYILEIERSYDKIFREERQKNSEASDFAAKKAKEWDDGRYENLKATAHKWNQKLEKEKEELEKEIEELKAKAAGRWNEELGVQIKKLEDQLQIAAQDLADKDREIQLLKGTLEGKENEIARLTAQLAKKSSFPFSSKRK